MQEFIEVVAVELGIGESESRSATSGVLGLIRERLGEESFQQLMAQIPGASDYLTVHQPARHHGVDGSIMGSLTSVDGGLLGGVSGPESGIAAVAAVVSASGIRVDQVGEFLTLLIAFIRVQAGPDVSSELSTQLPDLFGAGDIGRP